MVAQFINSGEQEEIRIFLTTTEDSASQRRPLNIMLRETCSVLIPGARRSSQLSMEDHVSICRMELDVTSISFKTTEASSTAKEMQEISNLLSRIV